MPVLYALPIGLGTAACMVGAVLHAGFRTTKRIRASGGDRVRLRRQVVMGDYYRLRVLNFIS